MSGVVILGAGAGRRLGGVAKALLRGAEGDSFLAAVWSTARAAGCTAGLVVVGGEHRAVTEAEARRLALAVAVNPAPERGMASSVSIGFAAAVERWSGLGRALLWPVDHPAVGVAAVRAVLSDAAAITIPVTAGRGGHPTAFAEVVWPELAACASAADGARSVVRRDADRVRRLDVDDHGVVRDVDTPDDLP